MHLFVEVLHNSQPKYCNEIKLTALPLLAAIPLLTAGAAVSAESNTYATWGATISAISKRDTSNYRGYLCHKMPVLP